MQESPNPVARRQSTSRTPVTFERRQYAPVTSPAIPALPRSQKPRRIPKPAFIAMLLTILAVAGLGSTMYFRSSAFSAPDFPGSIISAVDFPLYMPRTLPEGYVIDPASFSAEGGAVLFTMSKAGTQPLIVSEQARPKGIDIPKFHKEQIKDSTTLSLPEGEAVIGLLGSNLAASVVTEKTWIIISDPSKQQNEAIKQLVKNLNLAK